MKEKNIVLANVTTNIVNITREKEN